MTRTDAELFTMIQTWETWNRKHGRTSPLPSDETPRTAGHLGALAATRDLVESLQAGRWEMITAARLAGAGWGEIARAMGYEGGADVLRAEYSGLVDWYTTHPSMVVDVHRWSAALNA